MQLCFCWYFLAFIFPDPSKLKVKGCHSIPYYHKVGMLHMDHPRMFIVQQCFKEGFKRSWLFLEHFKGAITGFRIPNTRSNIHNHIPQQTHPSFHFMGLKRQKLYSIFDVAKSLFQIAILSLSRYLPKLPYTSMWYFYIFTTSKLSEKYGGNGRWFALYIRRMGAFGP